MIDGNVLRAEFAKYLTENTTTRWGLDAALMHVAKIVYQAALNDAAQHQQYLKENQVSFNTNASTNASTDKPAEDAGLPPEVAAFIEMMFGSDVTVLELKTKPRGTAVDKTLDDTATGEHAEARAHCDGNHGATSYSSSQAFPDVQKLDAEIATLKARNDKLTEAVKIARAMFMDYALHHLAKPGLDSVNKALHNLEAADIMNNALTSAK